MMRPALTLSLSLLLLAGCAPTAITAPAPVAVAAPAGAPGGLDPAMERRIAGIVAGMTLEQKVGQITQPDVRFITPDEVRQYYIGTVLNGGGTTTADGGHLPETYEEYGRQFLFGVNYRF